MEIDKSKSRKLSCRIGLLGASFDTGNMGVSALAESSMKIILNRWPDAEITLIGSGYVPQQHRLFVSGKEICVKTLPVRFSKNIFLPYHFLRFAFYGLLVKLLPGTQLKNAFVNRNPYFRILFQTDLVVDITGGDSFSDIYGMRRFLLGFLEKWLIIFLGKELILLPQTYGPFKRLLTKTMARYVMNSASLVYSRDKAGVEYTKKLLSIHANNGKVRFAPDVAFVLDSREPQNIDAGSLDSVRTKDSIVVGLNISGLLFNGGYTRDNMFGLRTDYRELVYSIIDFLMKDKKLLVFLVPHVFTPKGNVESDPEACRQVYERMRVKYPERIFLLQGIYDQGQIKYLIGTCNFFIGSRMHSCIAALSQSVPAVGLAYSRKFRGVFQTVGLQQFVIDMCKATLTEALTAISHAFQERHSTAAHLRNVIPDIQKTALNIFDYIP